MKSLRPGVLAVRAVNQYRQRDVIPYLGLRYYLQNAAARQDHWAQQVAVELVLNRNDPAYFHACHFKETDGHGRVDHRHIFLPGPNEALAEAALLAECGSRPVFSNPECVFSYQLNSGNIRSGIFKHYIDGLSARHYAIAKACDDCTDGIVRYVDIKRFYPSVDTACAIRFWKKYSDLANLPRAYRDLGNKILSDHGKMRAHSRTSILTGPMFSHLIGNLVLRGIDDSCNQLPARYFRYVDDITLVGHRDCIIRSLQILHDRLDDLGLQMHEESSPKSIEVPTSEWLKGRNDFQQSRRMVSWMTMIGDLKRFLLLNPEERENLERAFREEGFRIPIRDYSGIVHERNFLERMCELAPLSWFRKKTQEITIKALIEQARWLRSSYATEFRELIYGAEHLHGFDRKRRVPKLRYRAGRLIYLATDDILAELSPVANSVPELHFHAQIMQAVANGNIDPVLPLGTNAAQAAAQPLKAAGKTVTTTFSEESEMARKQALAVFLLNGLTVDRLKSNLGTTDELIRFAKCGVDLSLMKSIDPFMQEIACLHGIGDRARHPEFLDTVFDEDEDLAMDAVDQMQQSISP